MGWTTTSDSCGSALSWTGSTGKAVSQPCKARENFLHRPRCWSVRIRHLKVGPDLPHFIYFWTQEKHKWLHISVVVLLPRCHYKHYSKLLLRQDEGTESKNFPGYSTWDYSAPSWKGDEKGYSAMRTAPLKCLPWSKSNGDVSQMHHCSNNEVLILCTKKNGLWEDLCLKPTKINTEHGSGPIRQESPPLWICLIPK